MLVIGGFLLLLRLYGTRDGRPGFRPTGKVTSIISHQFSKLAFQLIGLKIPGIHAIDEHVSSELRKMLSSKFLISVIFSRLGLEGLHLALVVIGDAGTGARKPDHWAGIRQGVSYP